MQLTNTTSFAAGCFRQFNLVGALNGVVAVRGAFDIAPDQPLRPAAAQPQFQWSDLYEGPPRESHLLSQADFVPYKPGTDVTFLGAAYAPDGVAATSWVCGLRIGERLKKLVRVHGPRWWRPKWRSARPSLVGAEAEAQFEGWELTQAEPVVATPLTWTLAFGGEWPLRSGQAGPAERHAENELGVGMLDLHHSPKDRSLPAPRIEAVDDPVVDWRGMHQPQGFAPVPPWWSPRQRHVGTVDDRWIAERHPILPEDFDFHFWQCAPPDQVVEPWLRGDEVIELAHLHPRHAMLRMRLPALALTAEVRGADGAARRAPLVLDGVHIDLRAGRSAVDLTWRTAFACEDADVAITLEAHRIGASPPGASANEA